jgi:hypothetical protein
MWTTLVESLQGIHQQPPEDAKPIRSMTNKSAVVIMENELKQRAMTSAKKDERVFAALAVRGKLHSADISTLGLEGMSDGAIQSALDRLRKQRRVRLVMAKPYWEVVDD